MLLEILSNKSSPSGYEGEIRNFIKKEIGNYVDELMIDSMGNIIVHKKGKGKKVLIDTYMDEIGIIITGYNNDGTLKFESLGKVHKEVFPSKVVLVGENKIPGVIGFKPIHLQSRDEKNKRISCKDCCIDIGVTSIEEAKKYVELGEFAVFNTKFNDFGEGFIKGKAFNSRIGCYILLKILRESYNCDLYGVFNSQKQIDARGANTSICNINSDINMLIEGSICIDTPNTEKDTKGVALGKGPVITIKSANTMFDIDISTQITNLSKELNIPYQLEICNDKSEGNIINMFGRGGKIVSVSVPCRYVNSSISIANKIDLDNTEKLIKKYLSKIV